MDGFPFRMMLDQVFIKPGLELRPTVLLTGVIIFVIHPHVAVQILPPASTLVLVEICQWVPSWSLRGLG